MRQSRRRCSALIRPAGAAASLGLALTLVAGCVSLEPAYLANGMKAVRIGCGLAVDGASSCYRLAGDICGRRGFALFDWDGRPWPLPYPDPETLEDENIITGATTILVACRS